MHYIKHQYGCGSESWNSGSESDPDLTLLNSEPSGSQKPYPDPPKIPGSETLWWERRMVWFRIGRSHLPRSSSCQVGCILTKLMKVFFFWITLWKAILWLIYYVSIFEFKSLSGICSITSEKVIISKKSLWLLNWSNSLINFSGLL